MQWLGDPKMALVYHILALKEIRVVEFAIGNNINAIYTEIFTNKYYNRSLRLELLKLTIHNKKFLCTLTQKRYQN